MMATAEGPAAHTSTKDPKAAYGFAMIMNSEDDHRRIGQHGSLLGYSGSLYDFPDDMLTIVVLTNTEGQNAFAITRALARTVLGLAPLPPPPAQTERAYENGGVARGLEGLTGSRELLAQLVEIVDFAVVDDDLTADRVHHRLGARR